MRVGEERQVGTIITSDIRLAGGWQVVDTVGSGIALSERAGRLTNSQLRVLGFIASCGAEGCSETKQELAKKLQISLKTIDRAIHRLREEGLIVSLARFDDNGTQLSNTYIASAMNKEDAR